MVDWGLADRVSGMAIAGLPGRGGEQPAPYSAREVERACAEAIEPVCEYAGLGFVDQPPAPELLDRREWARNALGTLADAAAPLEDRLAEDLSLPGPLGSIARRSAGAALGAEAGLAAGYAARHVLGQFDIALVGTPRPPRLLFVAENLAAVRVALDADREGFLRWVALHETAHIVQFECVGWLHGHLRGLAKELLDTAARSIDSGTIVSASRRLLRDPRELVRALLHGELARLLADPRQRAVLDRLQATMSVVEGHAEHVMDACGPGQGIDLGSLRRRVDERRARRGGLGELIARLFGIDLKRRQYEVGKAFCDGVVAQGGPEALRSVWRSPDDLPGLDELEAPERWLARVAPVPA